jgi:hypothetical protein
MFDDGVYGLTLRTCYSPEGPVSGSSDESGEALAILRNGTILGSDRWGGLFSGTYVLHAPTGKIDVHVWLEVPAEAELITGFSAGPEGAVFEIAAALDWGKPKSSTTVDVHGRPIVIEFAFIGPLPN